MKLPKKLSNTNAIPAVLAVFPNRVPEDLEMGHLDAVGLALKGAGIVCEKYGEIVDCLTILRDMGVLELLEFHEDDGVTYKVGNLYNGI